MKKLLLTLFITSLFAQEFNEYQPHPFPEQPIESVSKNYFNYFSAGTSQPLSFEMMMMAADVAIGRRTLNRHIVLDGNIGSSLHPNVQLIYGQASVLLFPPPLKNCPYLGVGITYGLFHTPDDAYLPGGWNQWINLPITLGVQFGSGKKVQFFQIQGTPLQTFTMSYGRSF